jgi:alpha-ketoglutarate-dependent taurine dioxygenase
MKVSKIPGLGRFGVYIDDVDLNTISNDEWMEIGDLHLKSLVTVIRNTNLTDPNRYYDLVSKFGNKRFYTPMNVRTAETEWFFEKYNLEIWEINDSNIDKIDPQDRKWCVVTKSLRLDEQPNITRVSGQYNEKGEPLGIFSEGELLWHSNESGRLSFTPGVSLLGHHGMIGSATGFLTTTDWYEKQSESFRSELNEMIVLHRFTPGKINPGAPEEHDWVMHKNMCPVDDTEVPLVITSPNGITGLHYSVNTVAQIKGMSQDESNALFNRIDKELFTDEYIYDHWYQSNTDLCLFDNSITLHRRLGDIKDRMAWRIQHDYNKIEPKAYMPYRQEDINCKYINEISDILHHLKMAEDYPLVASL